MADAPFDAEAFRTIRLRLGLTQIQMAERLGVSSGSVRNWEQGRFAPSPMAARIVAQVLGEVRQRAAESS